jgi:hypothetical protein
MLEWFGDLIGASAMAIFTRDDLDLLLAPHTAPCVSILMPTHRHYPGTEQDPIRLKNLLKTAHGLLAEHHSSSEVRALLDPLSERSDGQYQMDGLALFCSADFFGEYRIPMTLPELSVVTDSFHVKPLIRFLQTNERYFVLALSQKRVSLYQGSRSSLGPVNLAELPASMADALGIERQEPYLNLRTLGRNSKSPVFHGHGAPDTSRKDDLGRFFRSIDSALWEFLRNDPSPLILAGVDYYLPLYREVSRCHNLAGIALSGNLDDASPEEIHTKVWPLVADLFRNREQEGLANYEAAKGRGLAVQDLPTLARMAIYGRVRRLLLSAGAQVWGRLNRESGEIALAPAQQDSRDDDILDDLAESVLARGGDVLLVSPDLLPREVQAAGILRW